LGDQLSAVDNETVGELNSANVVYGAAPQSYPSAFDEVDNAASQRRTTVRVQPVLGLVEQQNTRITEHHERKPQLLTLTHRETINSTVIKVNEIKSVQLTSDGMFLRGWRQEIQ
jgi:hypothetical protein